MVNILVVAAISFVVDIVVAVRRHHHHNNNGNNTRHTHPHTSTSSSTYTCANTHSFRHTHNFHTYRTNVFSFILIWFHHFIITISRELNPVFWWNTTHRQVVASFFCDMCVTANRCVREKYFAREKLNVLDSLSLLVAEIINVYEKSLMKREKAYF